MVDTLCYGNPSREQLVWLDKEGVFFHHFDSLSKFTFPKNSSRVAREELNEIHDALQKTITEEELKNYRLYDRNVFGSYLAVLNNIEINDDEKIKLLFKDLQTDLNHLILNLKYFFQRPRPFQLAQFYKFSLFPHKSYSADSPSYPSMKIIHADVLSYVLGNWYPEHFELFENLAKDVEASRLNMGLNYQSDIDFSLFVSETIKSDKLFISKYSL